jgi:DNA-binding NtrC family response regulator
MNAMAFASISRAPISVVRTVQAKLLRALQEREIRRAGAERISRSTPE